MSVSPYFQLLGPRSCLWRGDQALGSLDISEFPKILSQHAIHSTTREVSPIPSLLYQKSNPALLVGNQTYTKTLHCSIILFPRLYLLTYLSIPCEKMLANINCKFLQNHSYKISQILSEDIAYYDLCKKLLERAELRHTF